MSMKDQEALEIIGNRLNKMDQKMYDLNRYWSSMEQTKLPPKNVQYDKRKRQSVPTRTQTFTAPHRSAESQHSRPKQRKSTSDLEKQAYPIQKTRLKGQGRPLPPERSGSLQRNFKQPVKEEIQRRSHDTVSTEPPGRFRPSEDLLMAVRADRTEAIQREPIDGSELKHRLEEVSNGGYIVLYINFIFAWGKFCDNVTNTRSCNFFVACEA